MDEESLEIELNKYIALDGKLAPDIVGGIRSSNLHLQLESVTKVAQLLRSKKRPADVTVKAVVDSGLLSNVIEMLSSSDATLVAEASWILSKVTQGTSEQKSAAVSAGAVPRLVQVGSSGSNVENVRHNALFALAKIAADSPTLRDVCVKERAFTPALDILADPSNFSPARVRIAAWLMQFCAVPLKFSTFSEAIPILCKFILLQNEPKPQAAVLRALHRICSSPKSVNMVLEAGICPLLVQLCTSKNDDLRLDALLLASRFAHTEGTPLQSILDNGILQALQTCITEHAQSIKEACVVASTIAVAKPSGAKVLVKSPILRLLIKMVADPQEKAEAQREALTVLQHLATEGEKKLRVFTSLVKADCVEACCAALHSQDALRVDKAVRIIEYLIDTPWSGADHAIERLEGSDGVRLLRRVWLQEWESGRRSQGSYQAGILLKAYFPEAAKHPRV